VFKSPQFKGYFFAFITTITLSNVYIFSKAALNEINLFQFGFYWFGFAIIWNVLYSISIGHFKKARMPSSFQWWNFAGIGLIEVIATTSIFVAINIIPNPTIPAMIRNLEPVLIVFLALILLKEKYNRIEIIGVLLTILGTFVISYNKNTSIESFFIPGVEFMVIACVFYAIRTIWSKKVIHHFTALALNLNKIVFLFVVAAISVCVTKSSLVVPQSAFWNLLIGSLLGPFITSFFQFLAFKYIDASRATLVQSSTGFITLVLAYFYFGKLPFMYQIIGGIITIIGLVLITYKRKMFIGANASPK
jgi:drug/metabolite transporter (DMT)-like permease